MFGGGFMKRNCFVAFALVISMALSLCACGANADSPTTGPGLPSSTPSSIAAEPLPSGKDVVDSDLLHYGLYVQNGQLFYASFGDEIFSIQIDNNLMKGDIILWTRRNTAFNIFLSADGRYMIYPQGNGYESENGLIYQPTYYYIDLTNMEAEPIFVGDGIFYSINESFDIFTQLSEGELYQYDLTGYTPIATDVSSLLEISNDGNCIYYVTYEDKALYRWTAEEGADLIATGVNWFKTAENFNTVFYTRDNTLYVKELGQEEQMLITKTTGGAVTIYEDGTAYFYNTESDGIFVLDLELIQGDCIKNLYYYDGQQTHLLSDAVTKVGDWAEDTQAIIYQTAESSYIAEENRIGLLPQDGYSLSSDGTSGYHTVIHTEPDRKTDLYRVIYEGTQLVEEKLLVENANNLSILKLVGDSIIYLQDIEGSVIEWSDKYDNHYNTCQGTMYLNDQHIDNNVHSSSVEIDEQNRNGLIYYLKDWDLETLHATLCVYDGEKSKNIMDNVYKIVLTPGGELMFLRNYDLTTYTGELWVYRYGACIKLADNVSQILTATDLS